MSDPTLHDIGRGVARLHLKLSQLQERLDSVAPAAPATEEPGLDVLLDLIDAVESALERRAGERGWFRRKRSANDDVWRGLAIAVAEAREQLGRAGIEPAPVDGPFDPALHRAVDVVPVRAGEAEGSLAVTHRRGWLRKRGNEHVVLRTAQVSVHGSGR